MGEILTFAQRYLRWWAPVLAPATQRLLDLTEDALGGRTGSVVDVGTGTGTLAVAAVTRWPGATVVGIDPDPDMLGVARSEAARKFGSGAAKFVSARAEALPLPDSSVGVVVSSFAFQYVDHVTALREAARVLRPGGTVAIVTWQGPKPLYPPRDVFSEILTEHSLRASEPGRPSQDVGGHMSASNAAAELEQAGLFGVRVDVEPLGYRFEPDLFLEWKEYLDERQLFEGLGRRQRELLVSHLRARLSQICRDDFIVPDPVVYVTGRRGRYEG